MRYQYKRQPLLQDEATRLAQACKNHREKLVIWVLLDTGLRLAEFVGLSKDNIDWQSHRLMIYGKGGPYGTSSKHRAFRIAVNDPLGRSHVSDAVRPWAARCS